MSTSSVPRLAPDPAKADELRRRLVDDLVAAMASAAVASGHSLGLYRALAGGGPQTPRELAQRTGAGERYLREWLRGQAARGYAHYDAEAVTFSLTPEQAACLADEESATFMGGAFATAARQWLRHATGNPDQEVRRMAGIEIKSFDAPDEVRPFEGNGKADVVNVGGKVVGRGTFEPGWRWSQNVKPIAGTESCQVSHLGYCLSGRMRLIMDDGTESECGPGDVVAIPPGHDALVVSNEPCVFVDFGEYSDYAKRA